MHGCCTLALFTDIQREGGYNALAMFLGRLKVGRPACYAWLLYTSSSTVRIEISRESSHFFICKKKLEPVRYSSHIHYLLPINSHILPFAIYTYICI